MFNIFLFHALKVAGGHCHWFLVILGHKMSYSFLNVFEVAEDIVFYNT